MLAWGRTSVGQVQIVRGISSGLRLPDVVRRARAMLAQLRAEAEGMLKIPLLVYGAATDCLQPSSGCVIVSAFIRRLSIGQLLKRSADFSVRS